MSSPSTRMIRLPDLKTTFSILPEEGKNPYYAEVFPDARAWIRKFNQRVYGTRMTEFMEKCKFELFTEFCHPYATKERLRAQMDMVNLFWFYDAITDVQTGEVAKRTAELASRALSEPNFTDGSPICDLLNDFRRLHLDGKSSPEFIARFVEHFRSYADNVGLEAVLRDKDETLGLADYISFRRETAATRCVMDFVEIAVGVELPQRVLQDPVWIVGYNAALDLAFGTNDIHSYDMEQGMNHGGANIITVIMKVRNIDAQAAMDYFGGYCDALTVQLADAKQYLAAHPDPVFSKDAAMVMEAFGILVRGQDLWDFETERFFGAKTKQVKETGLFELRDRFEGYALDH